MSAFFFSWEPPTFPAAAVPPDFLDHAAFLAVAVAAGFFFFLRMEDDSLRVAAAEAGQLHGAALSRHRRFVDYDSREQRLGGGLATVDQIGVQCVARDPLIKIDRTIAIGVELVE